VLFEDWRWWCEGTNRVGFKEIGVGIENRLCLLSLTYSLHFCVKIVGPSICKQTDCQMKLKEWH